MFYIFNIEKDYYKTAGTIKDLLQDRQVNYFFKRGAIHLSDINVNKQNILVLAGTLSTYGLSRASSKSHIHDSGKSRKREDK